MIPITTTATAPTHNDKGVVVPLCLTFATSSVLPSLYILPSSRPSFMAVVVKLFVPLLPLAVFDAASPWRLVIAGAVVVTGLLPHVYPLSNTVEGLEGGE